MELANMSEDSSQFRNDITKTQRKRKPFYVMLAAALSLQKEDEQINQRKCKNDQNPDGNSKFRVHLINTYFWLKLPLLPHNFCHIHLIHAKLAVSTDYFCTTFGGAETI